MNIHLAPREQEYVQHVVKGESDKEIAREMGITPHSVRSMAKRVRYKLQADNKTEVAVHAIREGFVSLCLIICITGGLTDRQASEMFRVRTRTSASIRINSLGRGTEYVL
ncbi:LuxR C-terminal-related transcriptional regulator [Neptuniibacter sp.]|uniref:response regulator transcription factor n=1 Tax=Neptuniibacter sp. TaxID=1962643 RepID=UPI0026377937|nr:LuxR C-terminal-related transcriptional regulator [Neptuniibacter sp.]MCP4596171.1 response regulator transcription factor [Neptuniibacter sp.]